MREDKSDTDIACLWPTKKYWRKASVIYYVLLVAALVGLFTSWYELALSLMALFLGLSLIDFVLYRARTRQAYEDLDRLYFSDSPEVARLEDTECLRRLARSERSADNEYADRWDMVCRHEPRFRRMSELISGTEGTFIDAGCGVGRLITRVDGDENKKAIGFDLIRPSREIREKIPNAFFLEASVEAMPFRDRTADVLVCSEVLEHTRDPREAIRECHRVLKPGCMFVVTVPNAAIPPETINPFVWIERVLTPFCGVRRGHKPHAVIKRTEPELVMSLHKLYDRSEFLELLGAAPFEVKTVESAAFTLGPIEFPFRVLRRIEKALNGRPSGVFEVCFGVYALLVRWANWMLPQVPIVKNMGAVIVVVAKRV